MNSEIEFEHRVAIQITEENPVSLTDSIEQNVTIQITEENQVSSTDFIEENAAVQITEVNQDSIEKTAAIQITEETEISAADSIIRKLESVPSSTATGISIYRVPEKFRTLKESAYTPQMISIGPYHRGEESLTKMDDVKLRYVKDLLCRITPIWTDMLKEFDVCIKRIEVQARKCYSEPIKLNSNEFVEMMVIDGLFMIELFRRKANVKEIKDDDPIFTENMYTFPSVVRDLILLENQLPMIVLKGLLNVPALEAELKGVTLEILALKFFEELMPQGEKVTQTSFSGCEVKHLLDLLGKSLKPKIGNKMSNEWKSIPGVKELKRVGVKFVVGRTNGSFLDINFENGVMEIPRINIEDQTDTLFRNFIAFEQCGNGDVTYMTSYAHFMDCLIDSEEDVRVLCKQDIMKNFLGDDEDVAALFNKLCKEVTVANFYYSDVCERVNKYYNARWNAWKAILKRDYFNSPWAVISLVGAIIIIILTLTATVFAVLSFTIHKS